MPVPLALLLSVAAAPAPWTLLPLREGVASGVYEHAGLRVAAAEFGAGEAGGLVARLTVTLAGEAGADRLALAIFDERRQPLAATTERLRAGGGANPLNQRTLQTQLTMPLGGPEIAQAARWFALGPPSAHHATDDLAAAVNGAAAVGASSVYSDGYRPDYVLDGNPTTLWASKTGAVTDEFLVVRLAGAGAVRINKVVIDPTGEPGSPQSALKDFALLVSTTGPQEGWEQVFAGTCTQPKGPQAFTFPPAPARWVKLLCRTNHGDTKWMEVTELSVYAADPPSPAAAPELVQLVEGFDAPAVGGFGAGRPPADGGVDRLLREPAAGAELLRLDGLVAAPAPRPAGAPLPVDLVGCRGGSLTLVTQHESALCYGFGYLTYDFGNLLGGAPQHCAVVFDRLLLGRPARLCFLACPERVGCALRLTVTDADGEWFTYDLGQLQKKVWQAWSVALDPGKALVRGGERANGRFDYPLRLTNIAVVPKSRAPLDGSLCLTEVLAVNPAP